MTYIEVQEDLFDSNFEIWTPAHCIASDMVMGAGIAVPMAKKFNLRGMRLLSDHARQHPTCLYYNGVFNLITKAKSYEKPTYDDLEEALFKMRRIVLEKKILKIVMPRIGSGLDQLKWPIVRTMIMDLFSEKPIQIKVCYL